MAPLLIVNTISTLDGPAISTEPYELFCHSFYEASGATTSNEQRSSTTFSSSCNELILHRSIDEQGPPSREVSHHRRSVRTVHFRAEAQAHRRTAARQHNIKRHNGPSRRTPPPPLPPKRLKQLPLLLLLFVVVVVLLTQKLPVSPVLPEHGLLLLLHLLLDLAAQLLHLLPGIGELALERLPARGWCCFVGYWVGEWKFWGPIGSLMDGKHRL